MPAGDHIPRRDRSACHLPRGLPRNPPPRLKRQIGDRILFLHRVSPPAPFGDLDRARRQLRPHRGALESRSNRYPRRVPATQTGTLFVTTRLCTGRTTKLHDVKIANRAETITPSARVIAVSFNGVRILTSEDHARIEAAAKRHNSQRRYPLIPEA
ncbi:hypothetical protein [Aromatoleum evansii]|uniref:hypothetical protein n=1 Tax=Aromatoleum evansii TaxID=59406 RepID=UPI00145DB7E2|nr:hypothetical protein [Aromatoleum evansii]NMG28076.1 hypothetical protein [Aromatoleum evansii]